MESNLQSSPELEHEKVAELKRLVVERFQNHCDNGLFPLKFHLLNHLIEDLGSFGSMKKARCVTG